MVQACIYDYLVDDIDPVLQKIQALKVNDKVILGSGIIVLRNPFNLYEIVTDETHESFRTLNLCYEKVLQLIDEYSKE